jgi:hypothetical protein
VDPRDGVYGILKSPHSLRFKWGFSHMGIIKKAKAATVDPNANYDSKIIQVSTENDDED